MQSYASHRIRQNSLVIISENGTSIAIPLDRARTLLSSVQRSLGEPDEDSPHLLMKSSTREEMIE